MPDVIACGDVVANDTAIADLRRISPPLAHALAKSPDLVDGASSEDSVSRRVLATLIATALADLDGADLETTTSSRSSAMDQIGSDSLTGAIGQVADRHPIAPEIGFSVIAMGKWGARELNYYSDIDLVFVHESAGHEEAATHAAALAIASRLLSDLSAPTFDGPTLNVDADLRPEGTMGPLSRSLNGYAGYYQRWGEAWELQALLKARPIAPADDLGSRFRALADRIIWEEGLDVDALRSIRALKSRAEEGAKSTDIKRSRGGIRDIEFSVQILQLVHGRVDPDLRVTSTLDAIAALTDNGYIGEQEAERMADAYRFLRNVEHRLQLRALRQTHTLPKDQEGREWLGRSLGFQVDPASEFDARLAEVRENARDLHERLYFRPILDALVGLESARLDPAGAAVRLEALGFHNPVAATQAVNDLLAGLSRRSRVMHQVLPLMLDWLSQSPDPDLGLAQLRLLLAHSPDHSVLITLLQNNPVVGERLCTLLGTGRLIGELLDRIPEFIPRLADDALLGHIRPREDATDRLTRVLEARPALESKIGTIRRFVRRRKLRIAARDVLGLAPPEATLEALSDSADAAVSGAIGLITEPDDVFAVIAMGRWGGRELSYGSDIDLMYIHGDARNQRGIDIAVELGRVLSEPSRHGEAYSIDADLRPEGRKGPLSRSLASYRRYYEEWVEPWELLALVKARPVAGDQGLLDAYFEAIEPVLWRTDLPREIATAIRAIKARVESERIPADEDPDFHLKLGPGGLSDIEFLTQLLQLRHGGRIPELRVTGTFAALTALREHGILTTTDYHSLHDSYLFCTRVRLRLHLQSGRPSDSLPTDQEATGRLAASLGFDRSGELREHYMRYTRRARRTFESLFFD
ncbi:MAG TPA: bifunctional [glutamine synthetase] adenylyltransferase/[glutamine synthetase]-adenylyl-L-tyrosine phosphorylase [Acidimicrobiia bacterium]|nr:bifunctional [glutamine synthetase] adenylyltransferase/[glutamine synthetase]-adenylyl-L-tyrosine phosphorylase [Acidimicrobiia bacterium]